MAWDWLNSMLFGFVSGLTEFLPVSAHAHQQLYMKATGLSLDYLMVFRLFCHIGALAAVLMACSPQLKKMRRENRLASVPIRRRKRQVNQTTLLEGRIFRTAAIFVVMSFLIPILASKAASPFWVTPLLLVINGFLLYTPQFFPRGNKDANSLSAADATLFGIGGALGRFSGVSGLGASASMMKLRGCDWQYALELSLLLCIPALAGGSLVDVILLMTQPAPFSFVLFLLCCLACLFSFLGGSIGVYMMRFLAVKAGLSGFSFYCWGAAMFMFILHLMF